ncbi:MAG: patatin-like phospholipase family protein [Bradymonadaceae bacterium]|nr:patatin-like phospholipase family protein [Lujinxingiaceae bacterium]
MSRYGRHFIRIREIKEFEERLVRLLVDQPGALHPRHQALFRYAVNLAQMNLFRTPEGTDVALGEDVDNLRRWFIESIVPLIPQDKPAHIETLRDIAPVLSLRVETTRSTLLEHHANQFGPEHLDEELRQKRLVLVLGGGGGAGLVHLGTFALLKELNATPELIVGSSMGSIMGLVRAIDRSYDPVAMALALPKKLDYNTIFRPFSGFSRFGFPGAFHLNIMRLAREMFQQLIGQSMPRFDELPIRLEIVACGVRRGFHFDDRDYEAQAIDATQGLSPLAMRKKLKLFFGAVRQLSRNPRLLTQVVFGREPGTQSFPVIEAVGFSCAVPGLLHYDIFHDDPDTIRPLEELFERHKLLRLCDGGVVNNVPSKVAWESVQDGSIGHRNAHIMAFDSFAPISTGRNIVWIPIQQIARPAVVANMPYANFHKTFRNPPSPLQIVVNSYSKLKAIIQAARDEMADDVPYIKETLKPLAPYGTWEIG